MAAVHVINAVIFGALAIASIWVALSRRTAITTWASVVFTAMGTLAVMLPFVPATPPYTTFWNFALKLFVVLLAVFPWALYKMSRLVSPRSLRVTGVIADLVLLVIAVPAVLIIDFSTFSQAPAGLRDTYSFVVLAFVSALPLISGVKFWVARKGEPLLVRKRLGLLAFATVLLGLGLLATLSKVGATNPNDTQLVTQIAAVAASIVFILALAAPRFVSYYWNSQNEAALQRGVADIISRPHSHSSIAAILKPLAHACSARGVAFVGADGEIIATQGHTPEAIDADTAGRIEAFVPNGRLIVWSSPLLPLLREDPQSRLTTVAAILSLALNRREADEVARQLEIQNSIEKSLRDQADELHRANEELNQFVAVASHDLQAPMRNMIDYVEFLREDIGTDLSADTDEDLEFISSAATHARELIEALLTYTRVGNASVSFTREVQLSEVLDVTLTTLAPVLRQSGGTVTADKLPTVSGDQTMLAQLLTNLIENAIKYRSPDRKLEIVVSGVATPGGIQVSVKDNGRGVPEADRERIFAMFRRLPGTADVPGTGIGLAICKRIAERHGGSIWVDSSDERGTTIAFSLRSHEKPIAERVTDLRSKSDLARNP